MKIFEWFRMSASRRWLKIEWLKIKNKSCFALGIHTHTSCVSAHSANISLFVSLRLMLMPNSVSTLREVRSVCASYAVWMHFAYAECAIIFLLKFIETKFKYVWIFHFFFSLYALRLVRSATEIKSNDEYCMGLTANRNWVCARNHCSNAYMMQISVCLLANLPLKHFVSTWTDNFVKYCKMLWKSLIRWFFF